MTFKLHHCRYSTFISCSSHPSIDPSSYCESDQLPNLTHRSVLRPRQRLILLLLLLLRRILLPLPLPAPDTLGRQSLLPKRRPRPEVLAPLAPLNLELGLVDHPDVDVAVRAETFVLGGDYCIGSTGVGHWSVRVLLVDTLSVGGAEGQRHTTVVAVDVVITVVVVAAGGGGVQVVEHLIPLALHHLRSLLILERDLPSR